MCSLGLKWIKDSVEFKQIFHSTLVDSLQEIWKYFFMILIPFNILTVWPVKGLLFIQYNKTSESSRLTALGSLQTSLCFLCRDFCPFLAEKSAACRYYDIKKDLTLTGISGSPRRQHPPRHEERDSGLHSGLLALPHPPRGLENMFYSGPGRNRIRFVERDRAPHQGWKWTRQVCLSSQHRAEISHWQRHPHI